jgi:hypothetical protein
VAGEIGGVLHGYAVPGRGLLRRECGAAEEGEDEVARHGFRKDNTASGFRAKDGEECRVTSRPKSGVARESPPKKGLCAFLTLCPCVA